MHYSSLILTFASLALVAIAAPSESLERRSTRVCGDFDTIPAGPYKVNNNLWGAGAASPGGSQCSFVDHLSGSTLAWHTELISPSPLQ